MSMDAAALIGTLCRGLWRVYSAFATLVLTVVLIVVAVAGWPGMFSKLLAGFW